MQREFISKMGIIEEETEKYRLFPTGSTEDMR